MKRLFTFGPACWYDDLNIKQIQILWDWLLSLVKNWLSDANPPLTRYYVLLYTVHSLHDVVHSKKS